ncbi:MAG TPA: hypothetical protein QGF95_12905 [Candidatus Latescibacteria bacterium]|jgi:hypothetical protein|nr:hypothetical protein [Gemmatimonadaceae bacterium]HJP31443.1 hypothetical protein [Candidatus Latescibacterota bacterium]
MRRLCQVIVALLLCGATVQAQQDSRQQISLSKARFGDRFLSRYDASYLNYGWVNYQNYREAIPIFKRYDALGNYLTEGYEVFRMEEFRKASAVQDGSLLWKGRFYQNWMRHLIIASDGYRGWTTRITVGDAIRTQFTPLTLDMARFNGVRWDMASSNNRFTLLVSRLSDPIKLDLKNQLGPGGQALRVNDGLYLMGGHWESHVGDFLVLGATYLNIHRFDATRGFTTNTMKGLTPPSTTLSSVVVRFQDDSPEDGVGGAVVFDVKAVARIIENGQERFEELEIDDIERSDGVIDAARHVEASGTFVNRDNQNIPNFIEYVYEVPDSTHGVEFSTIVANDYRILIRQDHLYRDSRGRNNRRETNFLIVRRADDNVVDLSNRRRVVFEHGMQTGQDVVGLNARLRLKGFDVNGEIARSSDFFQFASEHGSRSDQDEMAGYVTVSRELPGLSLGLEAFHIGPAFGGFQHKSQARENAEMSGDLSTDGVELENEHIRTLGTKYFFNVARQDPIGTDVTEGGSSTNTPIYALVDDNDDMDQWPDDWVQDWDIAGRRIKYLESDAGIYPFFDDDVDGYADNNRNRNQSADSEEAFLMYFTDPREFYWGDDFNNNFVLDAWEDDDQPNYPYYKDERGFHAVIEFEPQHDVSVILGRYDVDQVAGSGGNEVDYGRISAQRQLTPTLWVRADHESKSVKDDISNPYFDFVLREQTQGRLIPFQFFFPDEIEYRDSFVHRGLWHAKYRPNVAWQFNAKARYETNSQNAVTLVDGTRRPKDAYDFIGFLAKGGYVRKLGRWTLMPRFKVQYMKRERDSVPLPIVEGLLLAPILRADYHLTTRTTIRLGAQGLPLLNDRRIDYRDGDNDSNHRTYLITYYNQSDFGGYKVGTEVGAEYRLQDFDLKGRSDESYVRYFVRMVAGVGKVR